MKRKFLASAKSKDVVCEVLDQTISKMRVLWYNVGHGHEPWVCGSGKRMAIEEIPRHKFITSGGWHMFSTLESARDYVLRRLK